MACCPSFRFISNLYLNNRILYVLETGNLDQEYSRSIQNAVSVAVMQSCSKAQLCCILEFVQLQYCSDVAIPSWNGYILDPW